jgi:phosphoribosylaminoimidazole-succinocarboxamide synthase
MSERGAAIREGKSKILYEVKGRPDALVQYFKDDATAFNAQKRGTIVDKGILNNRIASMLFRRLERDGVRTHFLDQPSEREMLVRKLEILPVEVVVRNRAAGSFVKRFGVESGKPLEPALVEFFYKSDPLGDPPIGEGHILYFGWMTQAELTECTEVALRVNALLQPLFAAIGLDLVDFKLEFGKDASGRVFLADEITPDGCRLWDRKTGESQDKDRFRFDKGQVEEAYRRVCRGLEEQLGEAQ